MYKYIAIIVLTVAVVVPSVAFAQDATTSDATSSLSDTSRVTITPASPFFFLKRAFENVGTFFTFGNEAKTQRYLALAERRLAEAEQLAKEGDERAQEAVALYEAQLERARLRVENAGEETLERVTSATSNHISVLERVREQVGEPARDVIDRNIDRAKEQQEELLSRLEEVAPERAARVAGEALTKRIEDVKERIQNADGARAEEITNDIERWRAFAERVREQYDVDAELAEELDDALGRFEELGGVWSEIPESLQRRLEEIRQDLLQGQAYTIRNITEDNPEKAQDVLDRIMERRAMRAEDMDGDAMPEDSMGPRMEVDVRNSDDVLRRLYPIIRGGDSSFDGDGSSSSNNPQDDIDSVRSTFPLELQSLPFLPTPLRFNNEGESQGQNRIMERESSDPDSDADDTSDTQRIRSSSGRGSDDN